jgi:vancomycin resistance protein VanJ
MKDLGELASKSTSITLKGRMVAILSKITLFLFWSFSLWMILWNVFRLWPGERFWAVALTNYFAPWFLMALFVIAIVMALFHQKHLLIASLIAVLLVSIRFIPLFVKNLPTTPSGQTFKVMSFNLYKHNQDLGGIFSMIKEEDPDIIALQELVPEVAEGLLKEFESQYPYHTLHSDDPVEGQGLMSKYELMGVSTVPNYRFLSAKFDFPQGEIVILNVHVPKITYWRWSRAWQNQRDFNQDLLAQTSDVQSPVLVVGDFNTTFLSENYALLTQELTDSFADSGRGFGFTYPAREKLGIRLPWPLVRIDFIFHNEYLLSHETRVLTSGGGSDHRPVISILSVLE